MRLWCKLPDDILHMACATVSFAISFGRQLKQQAGAGLEERLMKMPDPARRERQRALIEKGIETPFFREHIKVFEKTAAEMEAQLGKDHMAGLRRLHVGRCRNHALHRARRPARACRPVGAPAALADWFARIKARPSFKAIADYPPTDYDDTGRDGLKDWPRIKQLIAA